MSLHSAVAICHQSVLRILNRGQGRLVVQRAFSEFKAPISPSSQLADNAVRLNYKYVQGASNTVWHTRVAQNNIFSEKLTSLHELICHYFSLYLHPKWSTNSHGEVHFSEKVLL